MSLERVKLDNRNLVCILTLPSAGCIQGHVTYLIFGEITDNVSKTAHHRDIITVED